MFQRIFLSHPATVDETFFQHMLFALTFAASLFAAAGAALVHAFIPCLFEKTASQIITRLYMRIHNRGHHSTQLFQPE
ncbi:DUF6356 family protein [Roseobacter sp.]|uniref:DUF6356 family protein n=1 Tax=Roseobacter sp. TaxID=1907202 RepID=UPI003858C775